MFFNNTKKELKNLLETSSRFEIRQKDLKDALEFLEHGEYELCFDTLVTQMYEYEVAINEDFYQLLCKVGNKLKLPSSRYLFMKELVK